MNLKLCAKIIMSWLFSLSITPVSLISAATQGFCNKNTINHFFCDYFFLLELSCSDTFLAQRLTITFSVTIIPFLYTFIVSDICIAHIILKIMSNIGRHKSFST
ncbi:hypothetical protein XELAEV_18019450mg [Xenopus laevis]|uniref:G-protein coupled receptors family 1 profile domain-containing protein n=1 Tax=Xenopus laevis TaxID=8355 RepID=A0A974DF72_XENLA|nr:hypothetical protein XELAEV_18019450mg [Xenopus laevis]